MIASLPMYDRPENAGAHDILWSLIRDGLASRGIAAPETLDRDTPHMDGWGRPDLVLGQICNLPYRAFFRDRVTVIGASDYALPDTAPGLYHSIFIIRADDPAQGFSDTAGYRFALNEPLSQSGWGAPSQWAMAQGTTLKPVLRTGSHLESLRAVANGNADIAAIDAISLRNFLRWEPDAAAIRPIAHTHATPGMSFITARDNDPAPFRAAIATAIAALPRDAANMLGLHGIVALSPAAYDIALPMPPELPEIPAQSA